MIRRTLLTITTALVATTIPAHASPTGPEPPTSRPIAAHAAPAPPAPAPSPAPAPPPVIAAPPAPATPPTPATPPVIAAPATALPGAEPPVQPIGSPGPTTDLTLALLAQAGWSRAVTLTCDPSGGGHPTPDTACAALAAADGDPGRLPAGQGPCTLEYAPVTAEATGVWHGRRVAWSATYGNLCELTRATDPVFTF